MRLRRCATAWAPLLALALALGNLACDPRTPAAAPAGATGAGRDAAAQPEPAVRVENVLLITIDTLRADALGFMGNARSATPVLDRLAAAGRVYERAHAHTVMTLPSHANILTGRLPYDHGVRGNLGFELPGGLETAATLLREADWATGAVIGGFPLDSRFGLDRGFDLYEDDLPYGSDPVAARDAERPGSEVVRLGRDWWRARAGEKRFLWLHLYDPHAPYEPPPAAASRIPGDPYLGEVAAVDAYLAPLLEPFLAGSEPPTLIVFTSDHGEGLGDHGELTHGLFAYEATLSVPLVLWAPGLPAGRVEAPAGHVDLLPTILEAAGLPPPEGLAGRSLLAGPPEPAATYFESMTPAIERGWAPLRGVIHDGLKLIALPIPELYDLQQDPGEKVNVYASRRDRARALAELLPAESTWPPRRSEVDDETRAALESLGYLAGAATDRTEFTADDDPKKLVHLDRKMHEVVDLFHRKRLFEAARLAREVIAARPDLSTAHYYLAQVLLEQGQLAEAIRAMEAARRAGAASPALLRQLGLSLAEAGRYDEALEALDPLAGGDDPAVLNALGIVLSEAGRQAEARRSLERAAELDAGDPVTRQSLALVALRQRDWERAQQAAEAALARNPALGLAWNYLGTALYNLGDKSGALTALRNAVDYEPGNFDALYNAAVVAMELGEERQARLALRRFVEEAPPERYRDDIARARAWLSDLGGR